MPPNKTISAVRRIATNWAGQLTQYAKGFAPIHLKPFISSRVEEKSEGSYAIRLNVRMVDNPEHKNASMDARAQEYGSGMRSESGGGKGFIPIRPKGHKFLAFKWEVADANPDKFNFLPDGRVLLPSVKSPGIFPYRGEGYLRPAIRLIQDKGKDLLTEELRQAITADIYESFTRGRDIKE